MIKIARADLLKTNICNWIHRNLTVDEWLTYQGVFYAYEPACSNLPSPKIDPTGIMDLFALERTLISWKGRGILLGIVLLLIATFISITWILRKIIRWVSQTIKNRFNKQSTVA
jgi:hypothetical protein